MRKLIFSILTMMLALSSSAKDVEVILTRQITQAQNNLIPSKTDELKLQNYQIVAQGDMQYLFNLMEEISKEDYEYYVYKLEVYIEEDILHFEIKGFDPMYENKESRDVMLGTIKMGRGYFIVDKGVNTSYYKKAKGKTKFIREFEMVLEPRVNDESHIIGSVVNGSINFSKFILDGEDKLHPAVVAEPEKPDYQEELIPEDSLTTLKSIE